QWRARRGRFRDERLVVGYRRTEQRELLTGCSPPDRRQTNGRRLWRYRGSVDAFELPPENAIQIEIELRLRRRLPGARPIDQRQIVDRIGRQGVAADGEIRSGGLRRQR